VDVSAVRQAGQALQESERLLRRSQDELRALAAGLVSAQEAERRRVARELHDDIGQRLAALAIQVHLLRRDDANAPTELHGKLAELQQQIECLGDDLRRTARELHPFTLTHLGLESALRAYCEEFSRLRQTDVRFIARRLPAAIPPAVALCVYRVTQEALGNTARHAGADRAVVWVSAREGHLRLVVQDNGRGFNPTEATGRGLGLIGMEERVRQLGGEFSILSQPGQGACIEIRLPLQEALPLDLGEMP
jgi:signal transduction histidine kinase